jgi:hypothetical protein
MKKADMYVLGFTRYDDRSWWYDDLDRQATESEERLLDALVVALSERGKTVTIIRCPSEERDGL